MEDNKFKTISSEILQNLVVALGFVLSALTKREVAWDEFKASNPAPKEFIIKYLLPVAVLGAIAHVIKYSMMGMTVMGVTVRVPFFSALFFSLTQIIVMIAVVVISALIIAKLSTVESLGKPVNMESVLNWLLYVMLISTSAQLLAFIPVLSWLAMLVLALFALYFLWLGATRFLDQADKALQFCAVSFATMLVVSLILMSIHASFFGFGGTNASTSEVNIKINQDLQKSLEKLIQK